MLASVFFHRLVHVDVRRAHNDLAGFSVAIISVVYAVLLAFIAVATWEAFAEAQKIVEEEAGYVGNLYRDTKGFPHAAGTQMRAALQEYTNDVASKEWPQQQRRVVPHDGWEPLNRLHAQLLTFQPTTRGEGVIQSEFLRTLNELYRARVKRV